MYTVNFIHTVEYLPFLPCIFSIFFLFIVFNIFIHLHRHQTLSPSFVPPRCKCELLWRWSSLNPWIHIDTVDASLLDGENSRKLGNWGVSMRWHAVTPGKGSGLLWDVLSTYCSLFWPLTGLTGVTEASGTRLSLFVFSCEFSALPRSWPMSKLLQFFVGVTFTEADWLTPSVVRPVSVDAVPAAERTGRIITTWLVLTWWSECDWLHPSQAGIQVSLFECNFF